MTEARAAELDALLAQLDEEERLVSASRRRLHDRMAYYPDDTGRLAKQEREISQRRRELHKQIDKLRVERHALHTPPHTK